ncbi:hypothetical protein GGR50DRAFT_43186 [Xylaria sp. CBS 124048]|nr:hypothetical protein GGR50DRAFT_43186 [Xylaria sp. CBS 124048]
MSMIDTTAMNASFFARSKADDAHFLRCWAIQDCRGCLRQPDCSWCPFSWTCVPNSHRIQFLAPIWEGDNTCPHWAERWEIRTRPLGCQVSTITTLTALVSIAWTLLFVFLVWLAVTATRRLMACRTKYRRQYGILAFEGDRQRGEYEPLLSPTLLPPARMPVPP